MFHDSIAEASRTSVKDEPLEEGGGAVEDSTLPNRPG